MGMMLPRITTNYHAYNTLVYPISFLFPSVKYSTISFTQFVVSQEDNDQAFPVSL